jgi:nucleotide-binding universal stress UspA family protein
MLPISRILFPVDFSDRCAEMISYVKLIAAKYRAEITLLHVLNAGIAVPETGAWPAAYLSDWTSQRADKLERFGKNELGGLPVRRLLYEGEAEKQIVATAQAEKMQLVIMPTHGYGKFRKFLIGSTTSKVLHDLDCPVLTGAHLRVPDETEPRKIANIVCAIDLGPTSCDVLTWAARVSCDFQACLSIIHTVPRVEPSLKIVFSSDMKEQMESVIRRDIEKIQTAAGAKKTTVCIEEGDVAGSVCSYASSVGADLLVIGRGRKSTDFGRLRTNAYSIIRQSTCPVLSV